MNRMERNSLASAFKSNQSYIYYYVNLQLDTFVIFFLFHIEIEGNVGGLLGGGGGKGYVAPPLILMARGGGAGPQPPSLPTPVIYKKNFWVIF